MMKKQNIKSSLSKLNIPPLDDNLSESNVISQILPGKSRNDYSQVDFNQNPMDVSQGSPRTDNSIDDHLATHSKPTLPKINIMEQQFASYSSPHQMSHDGNNINSPNPGYNPNQSLNPNMHQTPHQSSYQSYNPNPSQNGSMQTSQQYENQQREEPTYPKITPGYTKYVMDEQNSQYDYVRGMFTEEEVKEAFGVLDMNKDGSITVEDLAFFLDFIGEKATQEEVEEMIRMCDLDGNGDVQYGEFQKMAGGWSLTPIGQAFPPTKELLEKRNILNQMMMERELSAALNVGSAATTPDMPKSDRASPRFGATQQMFDSKGKTLKKPPRQVVGTNLKVIRSEEGEVTAQNKQQSSISAKDIMIIRKTQCVKIVKENFDGIVAIQKLFKSLTTLEASQIHSCSYEEMLTFLEIEANHSSKLLFNALSESPFREEYVKNAEHLLQETKINLKDMILSFLGLVDARTTERMELAYQIQDMAINGFIFVDELVRIMTNLYCLSDLTGFEKKIQKLMSKKGLKTKKDIITKEVFMSMISEYGQLFEIT